MVKYELLDKEQQNAIRKIVAKRRLGNTVDMIFKMEGSMFMERIKSGDDRFDNAIGGGLISDVYILGAQSSMGKTTYLLGLAGKMSEAGVIVVYLSTEMGSDYCSAKLMSAASYELDRDGKLARDANAFMKANWVNTIGYTKEQLEKLFELTKAKTDGIFFLENDADTIYDINRLKEELTLIVKAARAMNKRVVLMLDYLQNMAQQSDVTAVNERANVDKNVNGLRAISQQLKIPVMVISSLSRIKPNEPVKISDFKESGNIEYSADILMALEPAGIRVPGNKVNTDAERFKEVKDLNLVILKNRKGPTVEAIPYTFYGKYNVFIEKASQDEDEEEVLGQDYFYF